MQLLDEVVTSKGVTWAAGYSTWVLWPGSEPQQRLCLGVATKGRKTFGFFKAVNDVASGSRSDVDLCVWPLNKIVSVFFFFFLVTGTEAKKHISM